MKQKNFISNKSSFVNPVLSFRGGFTLAEVLITLMIIGVVAALTISVLYTSYQKNQVVTQLKKSFSTMSQVVANSITDNGSTMGWVFPAVATNASVNTFVQAYISPYLKSIQDCPAGTTTGTCARYSVYYLDKSTLHSFDAYYMLSTADGFYYFVSPVTPTSVYIFIDINGPKPPNLIGHDLFFTILYKGEPQLDFYGAKKRTRDTLITDPLWGCMTSGPSLPGDFCGALIQVDGWTIADDYPWN